ncbi:MAG: DNA methyltransferase [Planctomycetaceae bacterium]
MGETLNTIHLGDCVDGMNGLPEGCVDLAFADPPFNIGYDYDVYDDSKGDRHYLDWSSTWIAAVHRALKPNGTFWLAIGDEYAAELKIESRALGFHCRSWVVWYYTFGVNCARKFTRSHAHLFHFVKDSDDFTFRDDDLDNRVPSARELVYNDKRANPKGRLPDDTWIIRPADAIGEMTADEFETWAPKLSPPSDDDRTYTLRPQDLDHSFRADEDTWYFPRVAGTFKERAGFHGCQMPEQLLGRIIRTCSNAGDLVLDPFSGSATTLAVAKKLGRQYVGFDISEDYVQYGLDRLSSIRAGDRLDGSAEPTKSAPRTTRARKQPTPRQPNERIADDRYRQAQRELTERGVTEAYRRTHDGFSEDRVVADPELNGRFAKTCEQLGLVGNAHTWNTLLFRLRKRGTHSEISAHRRTSISWEDCDPYLFASEVALQTMLDERLGASLDEILCDPVLAAEFDLRAGRLAPGFTSLEYRWAALRLRKVAKSARDRGAILVGPPDGRFGEMIPIADFRARSVPASSGVYLLSESATQKLYVGEALNLRNRLQLQFGQRRKRQWSAFSTSIFIQSMPTETATAGRLAWQSCLASKHKPRLNYVELCAR